MRGMRKRNIFLTLCLLLMLLPLGVRAEGAGVRGIAYVWGDGVPLRESPGYSAEVITKIGRNEAMLLLGSPQKGWQQVQYNGDTGFLLTGSLTVLTRENIELGWAVPKWEGVSLLSAPEEAAKVLCSLKPADRCYTVGINDGYYKILFGEHLGYVHSSQLELTEIPYENKASLHSPRFFVRGQSTGYPVTMASLLGESPQKEDGTPVTGADIVKETETYLGIRYVHGGESPTGFDCSGLTYYVFNKLGFCLPRSVEAQSRSGYAVGNDLLKPGDLVFFATLGGKHPSHVGIYVGEGTFLHSPNSRSSVSYGDLAKGYWLKTYVGARRLVP